MSGPEQITFDDNEVDVVNGDVPEGAETPEPPGTAVEDSMRAVDYLVDSTETAAGNNAGQADPEAERAERKRIDKIAFDATDRMFKEWEGELAAQRRAEAEQKAAEEAAQKAKEEAKAAKREARRREIEKEVTGGGNDNYKYKNDKVSADLNRYLGGSDIPKPEAAKPEPPEQKKPAKSLTGDENLDELFFSRSDSSDQPDTTEQAGAFGTAKEPTAEQMEATAQKIRDEEAKRQQEIEERQKTTKVKRNADDPLDGL